MGQDISINVAGKWDFKVDLRENNGHPFIKTPNLPEILKERGYATGHFGKWHLGTLDQEFSGRSG